LKRKCSTCKESYESDKPLESCPHCKVVFRKSCTECKKNFLPTWGGHAMCDSCFIAKKGKKEKIIKQKEVEIINPKKTHEKKSNEKKKTSEKKTSVQKTEKHRSRKTTMRKCLCCHKEFKMNFDEFKEHFTQCGKPSENSNLHAKGKQSKSKKGKATKKKHWINYDLEDDREFDTEQEDFSEDEKFLAKKEYLERLEEETDRKRQEMNRFLASKAGKGLWSEMEDDDSFDFNSKRLSKHGMKRKVEYHSKIAVTCTQNIVKMLNSEGQIIGNGVLIGTRTVLFPGHYLKSNPVKVVQRIPGSQDKISQLVSKVELPGPKADHIICGTLSVTLKHVGMKLTVAKGDSAGMWFSNNFMQVSNVTVTDDGYLKYQGDSIPGDCGQVIIDENGNVLGIHIGIDKTKKASRVCIGLPITTPIMSFLRDQKQQQGSDF